ncbi:MAG: DoxX family protein [Devosia sp.]|nr:DoxX family protein [Devosia sp.]
MKLDHLAKYAPIALAMLRIVTALLFLEHGTQKLFGFPVMSGRGEGGPPPGGGGPGGMILTLMQIAGPLEGIGGLAILFGLFTRPVAFILAGEAAVIYWLAHVPMGGLFPIFNDGEAAVLFCFIFLYLFFAGPGVWSLDGLIGRKPS